jgi:hypothetical protein
MYNAINTVEQGVHSSYEPALQPPGTMRYSLNAKITSLENGDFAWEPVNGNRIVFSIGTGNRVFLGAIETPYELYVFTTDGRNNDFSDIITLIMKDDTKVDIITANLNFEKDHKISGYYYQETNRSGSIYWTDNYNKPRWLNVDALQRITKNNFNLANIRLSYHYLVLRGSFKDYYGTVYSVGDLYICIDSNKFNPQNISDDFLMITNPNISILDFDPNLSHPSQLDFVEKIEGNLPYGSFYIAYRYRTENGFASRLSPMQGPYSVSSGPVDFTETDENFKNVNYWYDSKFGEPNSSSTNGYRFTMVSWSNKFDFVDIFVFYSDSLKQLTSGKLVSVINLKKYPINPIFDFKSLVGEEISIDEYAISLPTIMKCRELNYVSKYGLIGNIKEEPEVNCGQKINGSIKPILSYFPFDVIHLNSGKFEMNERINGLFPLSSEGSVKYIMPNCYYKVKKSSKTPSGIIATVNYNGITYRENQVFIGQHTSGQATYGYATDNYALVVPIIRKGKYLNQNTGEMVYDDIEIPDAEMGRGSMQAMAKGYWGKETYRIGILPISLTGKLLHVRWIGDITIPSRNGKSTGSTPEFYELSKTGLSSTSIYHGEILERYLGMVSSGSGPNKNSSFFVVRIANISVTVDLTDIIDEISGFCIVRAEREKTIISEGLIEGILEQKHVKNESYGNVTSYVSHRIIRLNQSPIYTGIGYSGFKYWSFFKSIKINKKLLFYITPEDLNSSDYNIDKTDYFITERYVHDTLYSPVENLNNSYDRYDNYQWSKLYSQNTENQKKIIVEDWFKINENEEVIYYKSGVQSIRFTNAASVQTRFGGMTGPIQNWQKDIGGKGILLYLKDNFEVTYPSSDSIRIGYIGEHIRPKKNLYGGTDPLSLERTNYIQIGHYQEVNSEFKQKIKKSNGKYICENIQPFGGDTNIVPLDQVRILTDFNQLGLYYEINEYSKSKYHGADAMIVPLQTETNVHTRYDRRFSTHGLFMDPGIWWGYPSYKDGIGYSTFQEKGPVSELLENYNNNKSYEINLNEIKFPGLPAIYGNDIPISSNYFDSKWYNRLRFTNPKTHGEKINKFIKYPPFNFIDIPGRGELVNIRSKKERLFIWMENGIFYIPVNERALVNSDLGSVIQLGVGSTLTRVDETDDWFGNQHRFGLVTTMDGFLWFDNLRRAMLYMNNDGKAQNISLLKGWNKEFQNMKQYEIDNVTDYSETAGIIGGFDFKNNIVFISFLDTNEVTKSKISTCVGIDITKFNFTGYYDYAPYFFAKHRNLLYTSLNDNKLYLEDKTIKTLYGNEFTSKLHFIINGELQNSKRFYNHIARGSRDFFDNVSYSTLYNVATGLFENVQSEDVTDQYYQFLNDEWRFSTPDELEKWRPEGIYMLIEFTVKPVRGKIVRLYQLITNYIKIH